MGFFLVDRGGVVRYVMTGAYVGAQGVLDIPSIEEIVRELERAASPNRPDRSAGGGAR